MSLANLELMPKEAQNVLKSWIDTCEILHIWESNQTFFVIAKGYGNLFFLRIFQLGNDWAISQDEVVND